MNKLTTTLVLCAILSALVGPLFVTTEASLASVDPTIWQTLEGQGQADVLVILQEQADLGGALALKTKEEKGWYVYRQLTAVAERTQPPLRAYLDRLGVTYQAYWIRNAIRVQTDDASLVQSLAGRPEVARIEAYYSDELVPAPLVEPTSGQPAAVQNLAARQQDSARQKAEERPFAIGWNLQRVRADDVWTTLGITGTGAVIGLIDTGVQWDHPALINAYRPWIPGAPTRHDYNWYNGPGGSQMPVDYASHGTAMAGLLVGDDGGEHQTGVAPGAHWIACPIYGGSNGMDCLQFMLAPTQLDGSNPRPDLAPHVLSNSWRMRHNYDDIIHTLYLAGIMFVKAAENEGADCGTVIPPGHLPEVTAVGAFQEGDILTSYSSRGPMLYNGQPIIKPNLAAPGNNCPTTTPLGGYGTARGTSAACPHVAGAVALILSARPDLAGRIDTLQMILQETADPMIDLACPPNDPSGVPNNVWGYGILSAYEAVVMAQGLGMGDLQGQVVDASTSLPIPSAEIRFEDTAGRQLLGTEVFSGSYSHTLPAGTYTLTASTYGYYPEVVAGVSIITGLLTIQDLSLTARPAYVISGTVTATDTAAPLPATVTVLYTPLPPVQSDPSTGFYSLTLAEGTPTLRVESFQRLSEERPIVADRDQTQSFSLTKIPYIPYENNPVLQVGPVGAWDGESISMPSVVFVDGTYYLFYMGTGGGNPAAIGYATSSDGIHFEKYGGNPILTGDGSGFDAMYVGYPAVLVEDDIWTLYYIGWDLTANPFQVGRATAPAPSGPWTRNPDPLLAPGGFWEWDGQVIYLDCVVRTDSGYALYYTADSAPAVRFYIGMATSPDGLVWTKYDDPSTPQAPFAESDPVLHPGLPDEWDYRWVMRSSVRQRAGAWEMFYGGYDPLLLSSAIGYATSPDGIHWNRDGHNPILHSKDEPMAAAYLANPAVVPVGLSDWLYYNGRDTYEDSWNQIGVARRTIHPPAIVVEPLALEATLYPDEQLTQTLWISNAGNMDLTFQLEELSRTLDYDIPWLSEEPISGTLAPGEDMVIDVRYNTAGLTSGVYVGLLDVASNDPLTPNISIPVTLTVLPSCEAVAIITVTTDISGCLVTFGAELTGTAPYTYDWDFGAFGWSTETNPLVDFGADGTYPYTLTVGNCGGTESDMYTDQVTVTCCEPVFGVSFDWTPLTPTVGEAVTFTASATGTEPITFSWDFGDGMTGTGIVVTHTFTPTDRYTVTLTVSNGCGEQMVQHALTVIPELPAVWRIYLPMVSRQLSLLTRDAIPPGG